MVVIDHHRATPAPQHDDSVKQLNRTNVPSRKTPLENAFSRPDRHRTKYSIFIYIPRRRQESARPAKDNQLPYTVHKLILCVVLCVCVCLELHYKRMGEHHSGRPHQAPALDSRRASDQICTGLAEIYAYLLPRRSSKVDRAGFSV